MGGAALKVASEEEVDGERVVGGRLQHVYREGGGIGEEVGLVAPGVVHHHTRAWGGGGGGEVIGHTLGAMYVYMCER